MYVALVWSYLEARLVWVRNGILATVREPVTRQTQGHAQLPIGLLEFLISRALILRTI